MSLKREMRMLKRLMGIGAKDDKQVQKTYEEHEYLDAYSRHTDMRVEEDPHEAVGGMWEEIGQLQFDFLVNEGLQSHHTMLDLGCGTLRGGRHFIGHLNPGNYHGMDISPKALEFARLLVEVEGLTDKSPHLVLSEDQNLQFNEFADQTFDFILAQSVFTHLKPEHIEECFAHIGRIMHEGSAFYFTFFQGDKHEQTSVKDFRYEPSFFEELAAKYNFDFEDCSERYVHPRSQVMVKVKKKK
ncbi:MAG: class I SAM-dependent methyltransferase [Planctomycetes bacterium]|nr:class I SAM-dependent methyltransferase [Planctomycetota bacterium]NOG55907.1 class I SAM-dependent methyltransferase [Planctomycetota bacterium]